MNYRLFKLIAIVFALLVSTNTFSQKVKDRVNPNPSKKYDMKEIALREGRDKGVKEYIIFDKLFKTKFLKEAPEEAKVAFNGMNLLLYRVHYNFDVFIPEDVTNHTKKKKVKLKDSIISYQGVVEHFENSSLVSLTVSKKEPSGFIEIDGEKWIIGQVDSVTDAVYKEEDILLKNPFSECQQIQAPIPANAIMMQSMEQQIQSASAVRKWVRFSLETDYDLFIQKGSVTAVRDYIVAIFAQVQTLYANAGKAGFPITCSELVIWDKEDPYIGPSSGNYLTQFGQYRKSWNGDLAHLCGVKGGGGVAYVNVLVYGTYGFCQTCPNGQVSAQMGYSGALGGSTSGFPTTYNWPSGEIAHEMGHNWGLNHTFDCAWPLPEFNTNLGRLDSSGYPSYMGTYVCSSRIWKGPGSIMSYFHMKSNGISFLIGFDSVPGNRMDLRYVEATPFLQDSGVYIGTPPSTPTCIDTVQSRFTTPCPVGWSGTISETRKYSCSTKTWSAWTTTANTCKPPITCSDSINTITLSCPAGYDGVIRKQSTYSCATKTWSPYITKDSTCFKCVETVEILQPKPCPIGYIGSITGTRKYSCITKTWSDPVWINNCILDTVKTKCVYKLGDTTYYQIKDTIVRSYNVKLNSSKQFVPYYIQVRFDCKTCCPCTEYRYSWTRTRAGITTKMSWTNQTMYYNNYQTGDILTCIVSSPVKQLNKRCIEATPVSIEIK